MASHRVKSDRLEMHLVESGPTDGIPVVLLHGNLSTGRFFEHLFDVAPGRYRLLAPDMRGFGETEPVPIDATRGLRDWADDTASLLDALGISTSPHLVGWSTGGAAIAAFAIERIPGWPGSDVFGPQPMVAQIRAVLERYTAAGGRVETEWFEESGHFPPLDARERWQARFFGFLESVA